MDGHSLERSTRFYCVTGSDYVERGSSSVRSVQFELICAMCYTVMRELRDTWRCNFVLLVHNHAIVHFFKHICFYCTSSIWFDTSVVTYRSSSVQMPLLYVCALIHVSSVQNCTMRVQASERASNRQSERINLQSNKTIFSSLTTIIPNYHIYD